MKLLASSQRPFGGQRAAFRPPTKIGPRPLTSDFKSKTPAKLIESFVQKGGFGPGNAKIRPATDQIAIAHGLQWKLFGATLR